jgi:hypothetical protein
LPPSDETLDERQEGTGIDMSLDRCITVIVASLAVAVAGFAAAGQPYTLTDLGNIGYSATGAAVSVVNGKVEVVGVGQQASGSANGAWYWTAATGIVDLSSALSTALGAVGSQATGINVGGQIVGTYDTASTSGNGFVFTIGKTPTRMATPTSPNNFTITTLGNVNDSGVVAGWGTLGINVTPFTYNVNTASFTDLTAGGGPRVETTAINSSGWLAGQYGLSPSPLSAYAWNGTAWNNLGTLANKNTMSFAIDANGDVVGQSPDANNKKMAFYSHYSGAGWDTMVNLGLIPGTSSTLSTARSINNNGQIVGYDYVSAAPATATAFLSGTTAGSQVALSGLVANLGGWTLQEALAIDIQCDIVGVGTDAAGNSKAFLLSAFPGDANLDGTVDITDLNRLLTNFDKTGMAWSQGDFDGNGTVDVADLNKVLTNFDKTVGAPGPGVQAVPEPGTLAALAAGLLGLLAGVRRRQQ